VHDERRARSPNHLAQYLVVPRTARDAPDDQQQRTPGLLGQRTRRIAWIGRECSSSKPQRELTEARVDGRRIGSGDDASCGIRPTDEVPFDRNSRGQIRRVDCYVAGSIAASHELVERSKTTAARLEGRRGGRGQAQRGCDHVKSG